MVKFSIIFYRPRNAQVDSFETMYNGFLAVIERMPSITRRQVVDITASPEGISPFYRVLELYFEDQPTMTTALNTEAGQQAGAVLYQTFKKAGFRFDTFFADVYEEDGGSTPAPPSEDN